MAEFDLFLREDPTVGYGRGRIKEEAGAHLAQLSDGHYFALSEEEAYERDLGKHLADFRLFQNDS